MSRPFPLLQLSAPHIGADWAAAIPSPGSRTSARWHGILAGRTALTVPSTYVQASLTFSNELEVADEPAGFVLHAVVDGDLTSHVQPVYLVE